MVLYFTYSLNFSSAGRKKVSAVDKPMIDYEVLTSQFFVKLLIIINYLSLNPLGDIFLLIHLMGLPVLKTVRRLS